MKYLLRSSNPSTLIRIKGSGILTFHPRYDIPLLPVEDCEGLTQHGDFTIFNVEYALWPYYQYNVVCYSREGYVRNTSFSDFNEMCQHLNDTVSSLN